MYIYGINLSKLDINYLDVDAFLRSKQSTKAKNIIEKYMEYVGPRCTAKNFAVRVDHYVNYEYESGQVCGICAILRDIIAANEGIDIVCDDFNGVYYLGIPADFAWNMSAETMGLTKEFATEILLRYVKPFTKSKIDIAYRHTDSDIVG